MGASDYMVDPQERGFGPPNMAAQLFGMISSLPDAYQQGVKQKFERGQMARTEELQKPIVGSNGEPSTDYSTVLKEYLKRAGAEGAAGQLGALWKQQFLEGEPQGQGGSPYGPQNPRTSPDAQTPGGLRGETGQPAQSAGPAGEDTRHQNIRQLAINAGIDPQSDEFRQAFAGTNIDRDFTSPLQAAGAARRIQMLSGGDAGPPQMGATAALGPSGQSAPAAQSPPAGQQAAAPAQVAQAGQTVPSGAAGMVPPGADPRAYAQGLKQAAERERTAARREGIAGIPSKAREDKAAAYDKTADDILKEIGEAGRPTGPMREARDPVTQAAKTQQEVVSNDIKTSEKTYTGLQGLGQAGQLGNQKLDRIRAVMSDPNFMSGAGHEISQAFKQWSVTLGGDPKAAQPMEEFHKTAQQLLSDDIKAMGASGAGPVRVAEVQIMKQATANLGISPAANRYLVEEAYRVHNDNVAVARLAQQYKQQHGYLDPGWDTVRDKFYADHPLFTKAELADPRLVSPPYLPKDVAADPAKHAAWVRSQGIKPGDPIKTDDPRRPIVYAQ